jgi:tRNA-specific 2-thiouridylase
MTPNHRRRIVVAMSGGVDSSATAAILQEEGWEVVGVTLQLYDHGKAAGRANSCCAGRDIIDAKRVADKLGIDHYVIDYESNFRKEVIDPFTESYLKGETPIPCVLCNQTVKFRDLLKVARDLGAEAMATGHYVRREDGPSGAMLLKGVDPARDQSYFLFNTTREQLEFLRFPLGGMTSKDHTRAIAHRRELPVAAKPDSQDICFVPDGDYAALVKKLRPDAIRAGEIVDERGNTLGRHDGIINFTVGQRKGLNVGGGPALYVLKLDAANARVIVGPKQSLKQKEIRLRDVNWLGDAGITQGEISVKIRSTRPPAPATLNLDKNGAAEVTLCGVEEGVSPGQACVFYDGDQVLGGGWIAAGA